MKKYDHKAPLVPNPLGAREQRRREHAAADAFLARRGQRTGRWRTGLEGLGYATGKPQLPVDWG